MLISDFRPGVLVDAPECPDATVDKAIRDAIIKLCSDALIWNEIQETTIAMVDGVNTYDVESPDDQSRVSMVMSVWTPSYEMRAKTMAEIVSVLPNWTVATDPSPCYFNSAPSPTKFRIFPTPLNANSTPMTVRAAYAPTLTAEEVPDDMAAFESVIAKGAKGMLMLQTRKPWSNAQMGAMYMQSFEADVLDERIKVLHEGVPGSMTVAPREFGY